MTFLALTRLSLGLLAWVAAAEEIDHTGEVCQESPEIAQTRKAGAYEFRILHAAERICQILEVTHAGKVIFREQGVGHYFTLGWPGQLQYSQKLRHHLTSAKHPDAVVTRWTGGAHCCFSIRVFRITNGFQALDPIEGEHVAPNLLKAGLNGLRPIEVYDGFLAYRFSSFASSATARVVLRFKDGSFIPDARAMRRPLPNPARLKAWESSWRQLLREPKTPDWPPPQVVQDFTTLVYAGHAPEARQLLRKAWPSDIDGLEKFLAEYDLALGESPYYPALARQL